MKKLIVLCSLFFLIFWNYSQIFAWDYEFDQAIKRLEYSEKIDQAKNNLLKISRGQDFIDLIDKAILNKKNNRNYLEKVFNRTSRAKNSTFLNKNENKVFKLIVDYLYYVVDYALKNIKDNSADNFIEQIFNK